jgi:hypothetical protein
MNIQAMNAQIRWRTAGGAAVLVVLTELAIGPETVINLIAHGETESRLWWSVLIGAFGALALLVEGLDLGRQTPHRARLNLEIGRYVVSAVCPVQDCPEKVEPNDTIRHSALDVFYREIDAPSREVAFSQWAWYYTSVYWLFLSAGSLFVAFGYSVATSTDRPGIRWASVAAIAVAVAYSAALNRTWRAKTMRHAQSQLRQIRPRLPAQLTDAVCRNPDCPST